MITPEKITDYNRTEAELEEFLLFAILVAGKKASTTAKKLDSFLVGRITNSPFQFLQAFVAQEEEGHQVLDGWMRGHRLGQYKRLNSAFRGVLQFKGKLKDVTAEELESVKGIGEKTSRFFLLHSRRNMKVAVLDTHIRKFLKELGYNVPKNQPKGKRYKELEIKFIEIANSLNMDIAELDLKIWRDYSSKS